MDAAAEIKKVAGIREFLGQFLALPGACAQRLFKLGGDAAELFLQPDFMQDGEIIIGGNN